MAADGATIGLGEPSPRELVAYIEQMLLELATLASDAGETALAASLALTAIQAGSSRLQRER